MGGAAFEFGESIEALAAAHSQSSLAHNLTVLAGIQKKINELNLKQVGNHHFILRALGL